MKNKIELKELIVGTMISEIQTPNIVRMMSAAGFDYLIIDNEHGYFSNDTIANMAAIANGINMPIIVRISDVSRAQITKLLDIGVDGLLVPMIESKEQLEKCINYAKYPPIGNRGVSTQRAHTNYNPKEIKETLKNSNNKTMIFAQIESRKGIKNLKDILEVPFVDGIFIGPNDLSLDLGDIGNFESKDFEESCEYIINECSKKNIPIGLISSKHDLLNRYIDKGVKLISCNSEIGMLIDGGKNIIKKYKEE